MSSVVHEMPFGFSSDPFALAPDPRFLYLSPQHKEALAHLLYGVGTEGGVVVLTGEIGAGKTVVCSCLMQELPGHVDVASVAEPGSGVEMLLQQICRGFAVDVPPAASPGELIECLDAFLLANHAQGRQSVLMIDEAQRLGVDLLEQLRLLTNLETHERKLLQIVLVGQPDLRDLLARPELRQLAQRIVARCHLRPLPRREVAPYVQHRIALAGGPAHLFPARLMWRLHALSQGVPRTINQLCARALRAAAARGVGSVDKALLAQAAREIGIARSAAAMAVVAPWEPSPATLAPAAVALATVCATWVFVAGNVGDPLAAANASSALAAPAVDAAPPAPVETRHTGSVPASMPASMPATAGAASFGWPATDIAGTPPAQAYTALLGRWGAAAHAAPWQGCASPRQDGLRCLRGRAGLAELRALNLPAVLHLKNDEGRFVDALLQILQGDTVSLRIADTEHRLTLDELATRWQGDYTVLWQAPPAYREALQLGHRGPAVAWLRERLALVRGEATPLQAERPFDAKLLSQVREFQVREQLDPDGAAGVKTLSRLAARTDPAVPVLVLPAGNL